MNGARTVYAISYPTPLPFDKLRANGLCAQGERLWRSRQTALALSVKSLGNWENASGTCGKQIKVCLELSHKSVR